MKYFAPTRISENIRETPEGYLLCIGVPLARTGEQIYGKGETPLEAGPDGTVIIQRDEEEVFRPATMASFEGKAFTVSHPDEFVNPSNWQDLARGVIQHVRRGEGEFKDSMIGDILVTDEIAIGLVKRGLREVSCGYEAEYTQTEPGRGRQTNIVGNHVALVEEGRAGTAHAINDHKAKGVKSMPKTLGEKIRALFADAAEEAAKAADADESSEKKDDKKEEKASDEEMKGYDAMMKMCKDIGEKIDALAGKKSADAEEAPPAAAAEAAPVVAEKSLEDRLSALEAAVAKLLESEAVEGDVSDEDSEEEVSDEGEEKEESMDEGVVVTGDEKARAEILAPGIEMTKDFKAKALKQAFSTTDGKKIIEALNRGKAPEYSDADKVDQLFIATSEVMKVSRSEAFSKTKQTRDLSALMPAGAMSPEQINEKNKKFYAGRN